MGKRLLRINLDTNKTATIRVLFVYLNLQQMDSLGKTKFKLN